MATQVDKQNISVITTIVVVGAFAMVAVSLAVTALVRAEVTQLDSERSSTADLQTVRELKAGQRATLSGPARWADRAKGRVAIPIERAMGLVGEDLRKNPRLATPYKPGTKKDTDAGAGAEEGDKSEPVSPNGAKNPASPPPGSPAPKAPAPKTPAPPGSALAPVPTPTLAPAPTPSAPSP